ncbi:MAG: sugar nucleotide-binding protein [Luminiphilus sp.]
MKTHLPPKSRVLIIGHQGFLGSYIYSHLKRLGYLVLGTSRRGDRRDLTFSLGATSPSTLPLKGIDACVICAGITGVKDCEEAPGQSATVNVDAILRLIRELTANDIFTIFLSSSAVFSGKHEAPSEFSARDPVTIYGAQKLACEQLIELDPEIKSLTTVLRMTKCISSKTPIVKQIIDLTAPPVPAFENVKVSPISPGFVCKAITQILSSGTIGVAHLSGKCELSYFDFFSQLCSSLKINPGRISGCLAPPQKTSEPFPPVLAMSRTTRALGLAPEPTSKVLNFINDELRLGSQLGTL